MRVVVKILSGEEKAESRIFPIFFLFSAMVFKKYLDVDMKLISAEEKNPSSEINKNVRIM
jgi:hypothetical protein